MRIADTGQGRASTKRSAFWVSPLLTVRVVRVVLWLLVVSGPIAALLVATRVSAIDARLETVGGQVSGEVPMDTGNAEGLAELFVAAFLGAGEDSPEALAVFLDDPGLVGVTAGSWSAVRTVSLGAEQVSPGYFAVTVAADVVAADPASVELVASIPVGLRFYSVGVAETAAGWTVAGLPSLIPAPPSATSPELLVRLDGLDEAPGLSATVSRFFEALLAGDGELARYTAPSSLIVAVSPAPFVAVEVLEAGLADTPDGLQQVVVRVRGTDNAGRTQVLEYALVVEQRDSRWEVSELLPAPALAP